MMLFKGSAVALVTPFRENNIDYDAMARLIAFHIDNGTDALVIIGTTGESATLSSAEKEALIAFTVKQVAGRLPVIVGTGSNHTQEAIRLSIQAEELGANGLLVVTPYYNKATQKGLIEHYKAIADQVSCPIILYNVPSRTGVNLLPETVQALAQIPTIVGIKEASGDISQVAKLMRLVPSDFAVYSGNDDQILPMLSLGAQGVISVVANVLPQQTHDLVSHYLEGHFIKARQAQLEMLPLIDALFIEVNPIPVKMALSYMGYCESTMRLPLTQMAQETQGILMQALKPYQLGGAYA